MEVQNENGNENEIIDPAPRMISLKKVLSRDNEVSNNADMKSDMKSGMKSGMKDGMKSGMKSQRNGSHSNFNINFKDEEGNLNNVVDTSACVDNVDSVGGAEIADRLSRQPLDGQLRQLNDDPRIDKTTRSNGATSTRKIQKTRGGGRNTESFDPASTLVRPDLRLLMGPKREVLNKTLKHDDVVVVPEFFCDEDDWSIYYKLVEEMRDIQSKNVKGSEWISWHEGDQEIFNLDLY
jgi:hypothetical protein